MLLQASGSISNNLLGAIRFVLHEAGTEPTFSPFKGVVGSGGGVHEQVEFPVPVGVAKDWFANKSFLWGLECGQSLRREGALGPSGRLPGEAL